MFLANLDLRMRKSEGRTFGMGAGDDRGAAPGGVPWVLAPELGAQLTGMGPGRVDGLADPRLQCCGWCRADTHGVESWWEEVEDRGVQDRLWGLKGPCPCQRGWRGPGIREEERKAVAGERVLSSPRGPPSPSLSEACGGVTEVGRGVQVGEQNGAGFLGMTRWGSLGIRDWSRVPGEVAKVQWGPWGHDRGGTGFMGISKGCSLGVTKVRLWTSPSASQDHQDMEQRWVWVLRNRRRGLWGS